MSAQLATASPRRIKASHRRRRRIASGQSVQRYYDPMLGMTLSVDPVTAYSSPVINFCRYCYARNNPYRFSDPDGRQAVPMPLPLPPPPPPPVLPSEMPTNTAPQTVDLARVVVRAYENRQEQKTHVTYTMTKPDGFGKITYVGRASGYGTPEQVMMQRYSRHWLRRLEGYGNPTLDKSAQGESGKLAVRGREQQMIDYKGGVDSENVGNIIRGVAKDNPNGLIYHEASNAMFGPLNSYTGHSWFNFGE